MLNPARITILLLVIALCLGAAVPTHQAVAQSNNDAQLPAVFAGTVRVDHNTPPDGTPISAFIEDATVASTTVTDGSYAIPIPPSPQTNYSGKTVNFEIDGKAAREKGIWTSDGGGTLDLSYRSPSPAFVRKGVVGVNTVLTDSDGMVLYTHTNAPDGKAEGENLLPCASDECLRDWSPFTTAGQPVAGPNVNAAHLDSILHPAAGQQVTYNGWPLYHYLGDRNPAQARGQGELHAWWVVSTGGNPVAGTGKAGPQGPKGEDGGPGPKGDPGTPGGKGASGSPGSAGLSGIDGRDGQDGLDGRDGIDGKDGLEGPSGPPGPPGPQGPAGPQGPEGPAGSEGLTGMAGDVGAAGNTGDIALVIALVALGFILVPKIFNTIKRRRNNGGTAD